MEKIGYNEVNSDLNERAPYCVFSLNNWSIVPLSQIKSQIKIIGELLLISFIKFKAINTTPNKSTK
jgi:hypothetical protein